MTNTVQNLCNTKGTKTASFNLKLSWLGFLFDQTCPMLASECYSREIATAAQNKDEFIFKVCIQIILSV